jgi:hypothetical protein
MREEKACVTALFPGFFSSLPRERLIGGTQEQTVASPSRRETFPFPRKRHARLRSIEPTATPRGAMDDDDGLTGTLGGSGDAAAGVTKSEPPAPPREEMVANAVAFLRHPQVATSPEHSKRAFLEKKGLTEPEIAEAFRRVPQEAVTNAADGADAKTKAANDAKDPKGASKEQGLRWTQVVARAGAAVAAVSWAYKTLRPKSDSDAPGATSTRVPPPLPSAGASDASTASASAERTAAALAQAVAAAEAAQRDAAEARARAAAAERARDLAAPPPPSLTADDVSTAVEAAKRDLRRELESVVARAVRDARIANDSDSLGGPLGSLATPEGLEPSAGVRRELAAIKAMLASSPLVSANANAVSHTARATRLDGDSARTPPDVSDDRTPRMRAEAFSFGEDASVLGGSASPEQDSEEASSGGGVRFVSSFPDVVVPPSAGKSRASLASPAGDSKTPANGHGSSPPSTPADPPHPASYRDVLDMLDKGVTPPGIRDIDDKPPDPSRAVPRAQVEPRRKPWEAAGSVTDASNGPERHTENDFSANDAGGSEPGTKTSFENQNDADASFGGEGWRPPSVPSMSSEASEVLFGRKKLSERAADEKEGTERKQDEQRTFAGFDSPGGSFAG